MALVESYVRATPKSIRQGQLPTTAASAFTVIVLTSVLIHAILLSAIGGVSAALSVTPISGLFVQFPSDALAGKGGLTLGQMTAVLLYSIFAALLGLIPPRFIKDDTAEDTVLGLFKYAETDTDLQTIAYVYIDSYPPGKEEEGGYVGAVSEIRLTTDGAIDWVQLIDPNRFTIKATDGADPRIDIKEWKAARVGPVDQLEARLPVATITSDDFSHVVIALFSQTTSELTNDELKGGITDTE